MAVLPRPTAIELSSRQALYVVLSSQLCILNKLHSLEYKTHPSLSRSMSAFSCLLGVTAPCGHKIVVSTRHELSNMSNPQPAFCLHLRVRPPSAILLFFRHTFGLLFIGFWGASGFKGSSRPSPVHALFVFIAHWVQHSLSSPTFINFSYSGHAISLSATEEDKK